MSNLIKYALEAWDPSTLEDITKLEKVQRQAARFAHSNYHDRAPGCVTKIVSDLGWEPLQHRRRVERLSTLYKIQQGLVETDTDDIIRPSNKGTRGQPSCNCVSLQEFLLPKDHPRVEHFTHLCHRCRHLGGILRQSRSIPACPAVLIIYADCF